MTSRDIRFDLAITEAVADAEQLDDLTVRLMRELRELALSLWNALPARRYRKALNGIRAP